MRSDPNDPTPQVTLCLGHRRNREMLAQLLAEYEVVDVIDTVPLETDLCVVDERRIAQSSDSIGRWKEVERPVYAPVLLLLRSDTGRRWEQYTTVVDGHVDAIQQIPAPKAVLRSRVHSLLEARHYSRMVDEREAELRRQNEQLEQFASIVSHDLQNPLSVAMGWLDEARTECESETLEYVANAHDRMDALIMDLLALAKSGTDPDTSDPCDVSSVSARAWANVPTKAATLEIVDDSTVNADERLLLQLLENLFKNAVVHGGDDVTVRVGERPDGFYVEDTGPGIPADERERVFEFRYSPSQAGTGIGLSIVDQIVTAHGWEIDVTESEEGGARFEILTRPSAQNTAQPAGESR